MPYIYGEGHISRNDPGRKMNCKDIIQAYLDSLKEKFVVEPADNGCIIHTPYLDPSNDLLMIFIEKMDDHFRISDMTQAFEYLFLHGIEIKQNSKQKWYLNTTLNRLGINLGINELFVDVSKEEIPDGIIRLTEAIRAIESLILTAKIRKYSDFEEEVAGWLRDNKIISERNQEFRGSAGRSIIVDFVIPRATIPVFMYALHSESRGYAGRLSDETIVDLLELERINIKFYSVCVLDDIVDEDVWRTSFATLKTYANKVTFWEDRDELREVLA
jgi:hypothetical protein